MALRTWLTSSVIRNYPHTRPNSASQLELNAALNEQVSFQIAMRHDAGWPQNVSVAAIGPKGWSVRVRRVGYVPVPHHNTPLLTSKQDFDTAAQIPGFVPDPLLDENEMLLAGDETHSFWITVNPGRGASPGIHTITVRICPEKGRIASHKVRVRLHNVVLKKRKNFSITQWFYVDALMDWYKTDMFDKRFWEILPEYMKDVASHGQNSIYVPVFTPPLDGVKRPSQLLNVTKTGKDKYRFDWRDVRKYVRMARKCGVTHFEWCHPFTQWGCQGAIRIYEGQGRDEKLLWPPSTTGTSKTYRAFLSQYLPELHSFLSKEGVLKNTYFHVSDEPHGDEHLKSYRKARAMLKELAPWMKVMDALTDIEFARRGLTDMPIPSIQSALDFVKEDIPCWCYYCCGPRGKYLNRLLDTPLAKIAMHGFLFYRWPFQGFLHWGYNYWYKSQTRQLIDPYVEQSGDHWERGWAYGDTFVVYPGPNGPVDSMRWEIFGECLQDYQLLQTLDINRDGKLLATIKDFENFPKTEKWRAETRKKLLEMGSRRQ